MCSHVGIKKENSISKRQETHLVADLNHLPHRGSDLVDAVQVGPRELSWTESRGCLLSHWGDGSNGGSWHIANVNHLRGDLRSSVLLRAVPGDVAGLTALVAGLASSVEGTAVGSGAVAGNVTQLTTSVALHGLSLAVAGKVVRAAALVAGGRSGTTAEATSAVAAGKAAATHRSATAHSRSNGVGASTLQTNGSVHEVQLLGRTG